MVSSFRQTDGGSRLSRRSRTGGRSCGCGCWMRSRRNHCRARRARHTRSGQPDSRFIGFFADGKLKAIEVSGGSPHVVCAAPFGRSGTWNKRGVIVFARSSRDALYRVSATGGVPLQVSALDLAKGDWGHRTPSFFRTANTSLYVVRSTQQDREGVYVGDLPAFRGTRLLPNDSTVMFAAPGHVALRRRRHARGQPFDTVASRSPVRAIRDRASRRLRRRNRPGVFLRLGQRRVDLPRARRPEHAAGVVRSQGQEAGTIGPPGQYWDLSLSPRQAGCGDADGSVARRPRHLGDRACAGPMSQLTFHAANEFLPAWSPNGTSIIYSGREGEPTAPVAPADRGRQRRAWRHIDDHEMLVTDLSRDGKLRALQPDRSDPEVSQRHLVLSLADRQAWKFMGTIFRETQGRFSPDGQWIAYSSDESGRPEVYVQSFHSPGARSRCRSPAEVIPPGAGTVASCSTSIPRAALRGEGQAGPTFQPERPLALFQTDLRKLAQSAAGVDYAVADAGQRVLVKTPVQGRDVAANHGRLELGGEPDSTDEDMLRHDEAKTSWRVYWPDPAVAGAGSTLSMPPGLASTTR